MPLSKRKFLVLTGRMMNNTTIRAIQQGYILLIAIAVVQGFAYLFLTFPMAGYQAFLAGQGHIWLREPLMILSAIFRDYAALMLVVAVSYSFASITRLPAGHSVILPMASLLVFILFQQTSGGQLFYAHASWSAGQSFSAMLVSVVTSHIYFFFHRKLAPLTRRLPMVLNPHLSTAICALPTFACTLLALLLAQHAILWATGNVPLQAALFRAVSLAFSAIESPGAQAAAYTLVTTAFSFFGIAGNDVMYDIHGTHFFLNLADLPDDGVTLQNVALTDSFLNFANMGGAGSSLALLLAILLFSRNEVFRSTAKLAFFPVLFNIPSILLFGIPVICNPAFLIPFLVLPLLNLLVFYGCMALELVPLISVNAAWNVPAPVYGYLATGSFAGGLLQFLLLALDIACYLPFLRIHEQLRSGEFSRQFKSFEAYYKHMENATQPLVLKDLSEKQLNVFLVLVRDLQDAVRRKKLFMVYQPQFRSDGTFMGAEALIRWDHPLAGFLYPPMIISIAKLGNFLPELEMFIFEESCRGIRRMNKGLDGQYKISVNITGESLQYPELEENIERAVQKAGIRPEQLWVELTEQDALDGTKEAIQRLHNLKAKGHKLLIDDFGMGHTSVAYLMTNQFDVVKLDGSITRNVLENANSQHIVRSLAQLSRDMGLMVIAEFVDNVPQRDKLAELGCDIFQGYLYSKPVSMDEMLELVKSGKAKRI